MRNTIWATVLLAVLSAQTAHAQAADKPPDSSFDDIAAQVPEFGGLFVSSGALMVYLTDPSPSTISKVKVAIQNEYALDFLASIHFDRLTAKQANYSWIQLQDWVRRISETDIDGVVHYGPDDSENLIRIGVEDLEEQGSAVKEELDRLGIPRAAVRVTQSGLVTPAASSKGEGPRSSRWMAIAAPLLVICSAYLMGRRRSRARSSSHGAEATPRQHERLSS